MKPICVGSTASRRVALLSTAAAFALALPSVAAAQEQEAQPATDLPAAAQEESGNEIVVTATKREQTLQDVPVAVTVATQARIERANIRDLKDIGAVVPSLRVGERQSSAITNFFIRGFGNGANNVGIEPSVGVFIDGVYRSRTASQISDLPDIERIEVLRGPQSTLFGKNASAGIVSIVTQKPKFDFGGNVEASYGNYDALVLKGVVTGPITDTLAASISGGYNRRDGYAKNLGTGNDMNDRNRWFVRGQLLFEPNSQLSVRIIGDYGKIDEVCCSVVNLRQSAVTAAIRAVGGNVNAPSQRFDDIVYTNYDPVNRIKNYGVSGQIDYEVGPVKLTSITAYRRTDSYNNYDADFTSADLLQITASDTRIKTFTQEFRASASILDKITALVGAYYFNEHIRQDGPIQFGSAFRPYADQLIRGRTNGLLNVASLEALLSPSAGRNLSGLFFAQGQGLDEHYRMKNESISIFSQVDFEIVDRLTLTGGVNYTHDSKKFAIDIQSTDVFSGITLPALLAPLRALQFLPPSLNVPNAVEPGKTSDDNVSWTARLSYDVNHAINVYAGVATGFKASSVNLSRDSRPSLADRPAIEAARLNVANQTYGSRFASPEKATVYEAGLKANWGLATANVAVFKQNIKGFQSNIFTGTGFFLGNAGKQSVFGIEFEGTVRPARGLQLGLAMTYLAPKYDDFKNSAFGDATGITPSDIPPISATFNLTYDHELPNSDHLIFYGDFHYESDVQTVEGLPAFIARDANGEVIKDSNGVPIGYKPGLDAAREFRREVNELNASVTYAMHNGLELSVWGRNLLDNRYINVIFDSVAQQGSVSGYVNQPRTYGVSARFRW